MRQWFSPKNLLGWHFSVWATPHCHFPRSGRLPTAPASLNVSSVRNSYKQYLSSMKEALLCKGLLSGAASVPFGGSHISGSSESKFGLRRLKFETASRPFFVQGHNLGFLFLCQCLHNDSITRPSSRWWSKKHLHIEHNFNLDFVLTPVKARVQCSPSRPYHGYANSEEETPQLARLLSRHHPAH